MTIEEFAKKYRLKLRVDDEDGTTIIPGKKHELRGGGEEDSINHIYEYDEGRLGVMVGVKTAREWNFRRKLLEGVGMEIVQDGDTEGAGVFDPENKAQAKMAIKVGKVKPKMEMSEKRRKNLEEARKRSPLMTGQIVRPQNKPKRRSEG